MDLQISNKEQSTKFDVKGHLRILEHPFQITINIKKFS